MLSRVADSLYWMMRYVERAENIARFADVGLYLSVDLPSAQLEADGVPRSSRSQSQDQSTSQALAPAPWAAVLKATGEDEYYEKSKGPVTAEEVLRFMSFDRQNENSILTCLSRARENARTVREVISSEMWEALNRAYLMVHRASQEDAVLLRPHAFFKEVKLASHLFHGLHEDTMSHNEGWHFACAGGLLERADQGSRIVEGHYSVLLRDPAFEISGATEPSLVGLLKSMSGYEMYRKKYRRIAAPRVLEFLLFDRQFPRSVYACLSGCQQSVHAIAGSAVGSAADPMDRLLGRLVARFAFAEPGDLPMTVLEEFLVNFRDELVAVDWAIRDRFFGTRPDDEVSRTHPPGPVEGQ